MKKFKVFNKCAISEKEIKEINKYVLFCVKRLKIKNAYFNIIFIDNVEIAEINKNYRAINKPTDVITFALEDNKTNFKLPVRVLGDIYISYEKAKEQAELYNHTVKREVLFLITHGILHLLGYDHQDAKTEKIMFDIQERMLEKYGA